MLGQCFSPELLSLFDACTSSTPTLMPQTFWEKLMVAPSVLLCSFDVWAAASVLIFKSTLFNELEWPRLLCLFLWVHLPLCPPPPFWRSFSSASFHQLGSGTFRPSSSSLFCGSCWQKQPLTSSSNYSHWSKCHSKNGQASFQIRCKAITHARPMVSKFFRQNVIWRKIGQLC